MPNEEKTREMKLTKNRYLAAFTAIVIILAIIRCIKPSIASDTADKGNSTNTDSLTMANESDKIRNAANEISPGTPSRFFDNDGKEVNNRIYSVPNFGETFPDSNSVQLEMAKKYGVSPVKNRNDAERRKSELVYVGASPYYTMDKLKSSIPYLVPRAAILLNDIGRSFFDSLQTKRIPLHKVIITSVLRTRDDVDKLRTRNNNATVNSCHLYGTTFDLCYNRYSTISDPEGAPRRAVRNDTLKWVLSEVLRDMRVNKRCYIKYEVKQGCFHITVR